MNITQSSLVVVGANTPGCKVFWNGREVPFLGIAVDKDEKLNRVVLTVAEDPLLAEMKAAGIVIRRV